MEELRKFCTQRKLSLPEDQNDKTLLTNVLEETDENPRFELFSDLAAELRVRIYEVHFLDFCYGRQFASLVFCEPDPPITKVSRLLRKEALPVFHDVAPLSLPIRSCPLRLASHFFDSDEERRLWRALSDLESRFCRRLAKIPERVLSQFRNLQLIGLTGLEAYVHPLYQERCRLWEVDLGCKDEAIQVRCFAVAADAARKEVVEDGSAVKCRARIDEVLNLLAQRRVKRLSGMDRDSFARLDDFDRMWKEHMKAVTYLFTP